MSQETVVETPTEQAPNIDQILADIYKEYISTYTKAKELKHSMSLKSMHRIFDAILSFPLDESAITKVKKGTKEFELFILALGTIKARQYINSIVEKQQEVKDGLKAKLEETQNTGDNNVTETVN